VAIAVLLNILIPGLGHVYAGRFARSFIWFAGSLTIAGILRGGTLAAWVSVAMLSAVGVCAAIDVWLVSGVRGSRDPRGEGG